MSRFVISCAEQRVADSFSDDDERADYERNEQKSYRIFREVQSSDSAETLRVRFNEYFAQPKIIDFYRGLRFSIKEGETKSQEHYSQGGGCGSTTQFSIIEIT